MYRRCAQILRDTVAAAAAPFLTEHAHQFAHEMQLFVLSGMAVDAHDEAVFGPLQGPLPGADMLAQMCVTWPGCEVVMLVHGLVNGWEI